MRRWSGGFCIEGEGISDGGKGKSSLVKSGQELSSIVKKSNGGQNVG